MTGDTPKGPIEVAIVPGPRFSLLALSICTDVFRIANRELGQPLFKVTIATADGAPVIASSAIDIAPAISVSGMTHARIVIVIASYDPEAVCVPPLLSYLRRMERKGAVIACADTAALVLARAGILNGRRVAVHHEATPAFVEQLGDVVLIDHMHAEDGRLYSSGGGMATADMVFRLVARFAGQKLADRVAFVLNYRTLPERIGVETSDAALAKVDRGLGRMVELMQTHLSDPLPLADIFRLAGVDPSTARRKFQRFFKESPARYYTNLRLTRARLLLRDTALSANEIATACGFSDASVFSRAYRRRFGLAPSKDRTVQSGA
ncbi:MAG: helix-turn-helix domain-containing protein [Pseudomonadota bacterium]